MLYDQKRAVPSDAPKGAWVEIKVIKGRRYRYLRWREGGKQRSRYLGKANDVQADGSAGGM